MIEFVTRLLTPTAPSLSEAGPRHAADLAALHAASFRRGWSENEFTQLLLDPNVLAHRALLARELAGFVMSRRAGPEAEILSIAVGSRRRGKGLARRLLDLHLRALAGLAVETVFLEVDAKNDPACRLYARAGFHEVGRREGYYPGSSGTGVAVVLRRDLA